MKAQGLLNESTAGNESAQVTEAVKKSKNVENLPLLRVSQAGTERYSRNCPGKPPS